MSFDHNPRKQFYTAVDYAIQVTENYLATLKNAGLSLVNSRLLELGPGADFAPHLVMASLGARVTLADKYLSEWDDQFHPDFYAAFLEKWSGPADAIRQAIKQRSYAGIIQTVKEPAEHMPSLSASSFDIVQSNAVLEHVSDLGKVAQELARLTRPGGAHFHQIDFRDHRSFDKPLEYLLLDQNSYKALREGDGGNHGTSKRIPETVDAFSRYFWIWKIQNNSQADSAYVSEIAKQLPSDSPYKTWPREMLRDVGCQLWFVRKDKKLGFLDRLFTSR
jgi:SAM-dependent methyltransferase